jgi:hypothetical protein
MQLSGFTTPTIRMQFTRSYSVVRQLSYADSGTFISAITRVLAYFSLPDLISCPHRQVPEDRLAGRRSLSNVWWPKRGLLG